jgi:hypothetical protein
LARGSPDFPGFVRQMVPILADLILDFREHFYSKSLLLLIPGRIAQPESVPFTRERSKVRSVVRPPAPSMKIKHVRKCDLSAMADQHAGQWLNHRLLVSGP